MYSNFFAVISAVVLCSVILACSSVSAEGEEKKDTEEDIFKELRAIPNVELDFKLFKLGRLFLDPRMNSDNNMSLGKFGLKGMDVLLTESRCDNPATRAVKLVVFDYTLAYFFVALNHEMGHAYRAEEAGIPSEIVMYVRNKLIGLNEDKMPFTSISFGKKYTLATDEYWIDHLMIYLGGMEADIVKNNKLAEDIMKSERMGFYDGFMYLVGKCTHIDEFLNGNYPDVWDGVDDAEEEERWGGRDVFEYLISLDYLGVRVNGANITSGGFWNMLDSFLAMSFFFNMFNIATGARQLPMPRCMVATDYVLAPYGPEVMMNFYYKSKENIVTKIYARKSIGQSYGAGIKIINIPFKTGVSDRLGFGCEFWRQDFPELLEKYQGSGIGIEIEAEKEVGKETSITLGLRAKTKGYRLGDRLGADLSLYFGITIYW